MTTNEKEAEKQEKEREARQKELEKKHEKKKFYLNKSSAKTYTCSLDGKQYMIYKIVRGELDPFADEDDDSKGDGGWVSSEANLSQKGKCWIKGGAVVCGNARVSGDARVDGKAEVSGAARICEDAIVTSNAKIGEHAFVGGEAFVSESTVKGRSRVFGQVMGGAIVEDSAEVGCNGVVSGKFQVKDFALVRGTLQAPDRGSFVVGGASVVLGDVAVKQSCRIEGCAIIKEEGKFNTSMQKGMKLSGCAIIGGSVDDSTVGGLTILEKGGSIKKSTVEGVGTAEGQLNNTTITGASVLKGDIEGGNISGAVYSEGNMTGGEISGSVYSLGEAKSLTVSGNLNATASVDSGNVETNCVADKAGESPSEGNEVTSAKKKLEEAGIEG